MERGFQSLLLAGKYGVGDGDFPPFQTSADTFLSPYTRTYTDKSILPLHNIHTSPEYSRFRCDEKVKRQKYEHSSPLPELRSLEEEKSEKKSYREVAYRRRHTLSEKTRSLQKLLPVDRKMEIATVYEESYNYIEFLKAQISALESMPVSSCSTSASNFRSENPRCRYDGGLGELNRQQLLEALVNSPAAQSVMYSKGLCVYSIEQLMLFTSDY